MTPTTLAPLSASIARPADPLPMTPQRRVAREPSYRWCFLLGLGGMTFVRLIGYMAFTEVYFLATAPWRFGKHLRLITRGVGGTFATLWICWVLVAITSDLWNDVPFQLMARGVSRAFFTGLAMLSVFVICSPSAKRYDYMVLGIPFSMVISLFIFKPGQQDVYDWDLEDALQFQTSLNYVLTAAIIAAATWFYETRPRLVILMLLTASPIYIVMGSRSPGAIFLAAGVTTVVLRMLGVARKSRLKKVGWAKLALLAVCAVTVTVAITNTYEYLAERRLLDEKQLKKYERESRAEGGVFFGSRGVYILTGLLAWRDQPILGHGSWPEDNNGYYRQAAEMLNMPFEAYRYAPIGGVAVRNMLPIHSVLVSALAEHGPLAFMFFAYLAYLNVSALRIVPTLFPKYTAVYSIYLWLNTWNLIASPQSHRVPTGLSFGFLLLVHYWAWTARVRPGRETIPTPTSSMIASL